MPDSELEQIYKDAGFMIDACAESRRQCRRQQKLLSGQREKMTQTREWQAEREEDQARDNEELSDSLKNG